MRRGRVAAWRALPLVLVSALLGGCVAPIVGIAMGAMVSGFQIYKTVQLANGGSVGIEFPGKDGKTAPVQPLPSFKSVAVWPGDEGDVRFAERLQTSGRFKPVAAPAAVSAILAETKTPSDLRQLTESEQTDAFDRVCRRARVEFIFAAKAEGASENDNAFSLSAANVTYSADLLGYHCGQHQIVWRDKIALVVKVGGSVANTSEMLHASGDAWADRVLQAIGRTQGGA